MSVLEDIRKGLQDIVAPEVRAVTARVDALEKHLDERLDTLSKQASIQYDAILKTLEAFRAEMRSEFAALSATSKLEASREFAPLSERLTRLEARDEQRRVG